MINTKMMIRLKVLFSISIFLIMSLQIYSQVAQRGRTLEQNSNHKPVSNVVLRFIGAVPTTSDNDGSYILKFNKLKAGELLLMDKVEKEGYEIVNKETLLEWHASEERSCDIILSLKSKIISERERYFKIGKSSYLAKFNSAVNKLDKLGLEKEKYEQLYDSLNYELRKSLLSLNEYSDILARINRDDLSSLHNRVLKLIDAANFDAAVQLLDSANVEDKLRLAKNTKDVFIENIRKTAPSLYLNADIYMFAGGEQNYRKARELYQLVAQSDKQNFDYNYKYALFLKRQKLMADALAQARYTVSIAQNEYEKAKAHYLLGSCCVLNYLQTEGHNNYLTATGLYEKILEEGYSRIIADELLELYLNIGININDEIVRSQSIDKASALIGQIEKEGGELTAKDKVSYYMTLYLHEVDLHGENTERTWLDKMEEQVPLMEDDRKEDTYELIFSAIGVSKIAPLLVGDYLKMADIDDKLLEYARKQYERNPLAWAGVYANSLDQHVGTMNIINNVVPNKYSDSEILNCLKESAKVLLINKQTGMRFNPYIKLIEYQSDIPVDTLDVYLKKGSELWSDFENGFVYKEYLSLYLTAGKKYKSINQPSKAMQCFTNVWKRLKQVKGTLDGGKDWLLINTCVEMMKIEPDVAEKFNKIDYTLAHADLSTSVATKLTSASLYVEGLRASLSVNDFTKADYYQKQGLYMLDDAILSSSVNKDMKGLFLIQKVSLYQSYFVDAYKKERYEQCVELAGQTIKWADKTKQSWVDCGLMDTFLYVEADTWIISGYALYAKGDFKGALNSFRQCKQLLSENISFITDEGLKNKISICDEYIEDILANHT